MMLPKLQSQSETKEEEVAIETVKKSSDRRPTRNTGGGAASRSIGPASGGVLAMVMNGKE